MNEGVTARQQAIQAAARAAFEDLNEERALVGITANKPLDWESFYTGYLNGAGDVNEGLI